MFANSVQIAIAIAVNGLNTYPPWQLSLVCEYLRLWILESLISLSLSLYSLSQEKGSVIMAIPQSP